MPKKGGKLKASEVKDFLKASYDETPPKELDGYILDSSLSSATAKVYYNPQTGHAVVAHRGTKGIKDWGNNIAYNLGAYDYTSRYKKGKSTQDKAEKKYGKQNISTLGHSQGAVIARKVGGDTQEIINVNPAYGFEKPKKNEYNVRSSSDIVSGLYAPVAKAREVLYPNYSKKHDITIPSQSSTDILEEHSYRILDRLGDGEIGVGAGNKISSNNIMKCGGRRTKELGYIADDIDWLGGSQGTPYINQGTNPYGTRGGKKPNIGKAFNKVGKAFDTAGDKMNSGMANVMTAVNPFANKDFQKVGIALGEATHDYLLPAVVSAGKPLYDAAAMAASTELTGNPVLGKVAANTLWDEMVAKPGFDPRQYQKSKELGDLSGVAGQAAAKPLEAALGGILSRNLVDEEFRRRDKQRRVGGRNVGLRRLAQKLHGRGIRMKGGNRRDNILNSLNDIETLAREFIRNRLYFDGDDGNLLQHFLLNGRVAEEAALADATTDDDFDFIENSVREYIDAINRTYSLNYTDEVQEEDESESESDEEQVERVEPVDKLEEEGAVAAGRKKGVDFGKIKWGTFTRMFKEFKKEHPRSRVKDLEQFANYVIKYKKKFSDKALKKAHFYKNIVMKGGASNEQIGLASAMRTYTKEGNQTYYALSDIVHSADRLDANDFSGVFKDLSKTENGRVGKLLEAFTPSYLRQVYYEIDKGITTGRLPAEKYNNVLIKILRAEPNANKNIKGYNDNWGASNPEVQEVYSDIRAVNPNARAAYRRREISRGY